MILGQDGSTSNELCTPEFINQLVGWLIPSISFTKSKSSSNLALAGHLINIELPLKEKQCITFKIKVVPRWWETWRDKIGTSVRQEQEESMSSLGKLFLSPGAKSACSYRDRSWDFEKGKTPNSKCLLNLFLLDFLYLHFYLYSWRLHFCLCFLYLTIGMRILCLCFFSPCIWIRPYGTFAHPWPMVPTQALI